MNAARVFTLFALLLVSLLARAEDGIVYQFKIMKLTNEGDVESSYTNAVLMRFGEDISLELAEMYRLSLDTGELAGSSTNVVATLEILEKGRPYYVGANQKSFDVGEKFDLAYERYGSNYAIQLRTSYGKIPDGDGA